MKEDRACRHLCAELRRTLLDAQEFFQLLTGQLLNPAFGMFTMDADTRQLWFR